MSQSEDPRYVELLVSFYSPPEENSQNCFKNEDVPWGASPVHQDKLASYSRINRDFWKELHNNERIELVVSHSKRNSTQTDVRWTSAHV
jgi:hypothetical protein